MLVRMPAPTLNQHDNPGSIATSVGAINFSQVCTGIGRSTQCYKANDEIRSEIYISLARPFVPAIIHRLTWPD